MNQKTNQSKEKAIQAIREYRKSLLEEFLLMAKQLQKEINYLYETGIDEKLFICLEGTQAEQDICYTIIRKSNVLNLLRVLREMNEENAMKLLRDFMKGNEWVDFYDYPGFRDMENLLDEDNNAELAEDYIGIP